MYNPNTHTLYLSRSAVETWQHCPKMFEFEQLYANRPDYPSIGIVPATPIRPLELGIAAHVGVEFLMRNLHKKQNGEEHLQGIELNVQLYKLIGATLQKRFNPAKDDTGAKWTLYNDLNLVYGLVLAFKATTLQHIEETSKVLFVEEEMVETWKVVVRDSEINVVFEARPDWATIDNETGDLILWNLKTSNKSLNSDSRVDRSYTHDLQGLVEAFMTERQLSRLDQALQALPSWARVKQSMPTKVAAIRYVFLIKGYDDARMMPDSSTYWYYNSPVTRGWKSTVGDRVRYAWSNKIPKEENKSGYGYLEKGWEHFSVWEETSLGDNVRERIEQWVRMLLDPGEHDLTPVEWSPDLVETPGDKYRSDSDKEEILLELHSISTDIARAIDLCDFVRNRRACTYPTSCKYFAPCREGRAVFEMIQAGEYVVRQPHHREERNAFIQISASRG